ncbi:SOS response-associated peptidase, partial [Methylobacterium tarhaniae]|uniref:SOS response-associated peptidase n=1 Tax=Methylobacterium tarhaniae TaxID=1187852 RepID=UPI003D0947A1
MCGRFTQHYTWSEIHAWLSIFGSPRNLQPRYNIAPTETCDVVRPGADGLELVQMRWWLIPSWWKKPAREALPAFNARAETVHQKPTFREAFQRRRCIVPASGFYEWTGPRNDRQGHYFTAADGSPVLAFAGLWDRWHDPVSGERVESCTIIVSDASDWMRAYHDRLAVILPADRLTSWLDGTLGHGDLQAAHGVPL